FGHDSGEPVPGRAANHDVGFPLMRQLDGELGKCGAVEKATAAFGAGRVDAPGVDPPPHRVHTDAEELSCLSDSIRRHGSTLELAGARTPRRRTGGRGRYGHVDGRKP